MELSGGDEKTAHVLAIPMTGQGHVIPMLAIAIQLARKGITVTFVGIKSDISMAQSSSSATTQSPGLQLIGLDYPDPDDPGHLLSGDIPGKLEKAFGPVMEKLLHDKKTAAGVAPAGPTCILSDMFLPWTQNVAEKLQIPRYMLVPSGVVFAKFMKGFVDLYGHQILLSKEEDKVVKFDGSISIPGLFPLRYHEIPVLPPTSEFMLMCQSLWRSRGVLANSFYELEEQMIETWEVPGAGFENMKEAPKIFPVGPFFSTTSVTTAPAPAAEDITIGHHTLENSAEKSLLWLSSQPSSSVLYIAFGSRVRLPPKHIKELAFGLEDSNQRFLWVLPISKEGTSESEKTPSLLTDLLPPGFEARVGGSHGCIVTDWVPRLQILGHSAIGAFLTHSGWNSSLESIMNGVPMISWPQGAEQHLNCRYIVDDLKIAYQIQTGPENILDRKEVERVIRLVMVESEGKEMRRRVQDFQRKGAAAVAEGGYTSRIFQEFVDDINFH